MNSRQDGPSSVKVDAIEVEHPLMTYSDTLLAFFCRFAEGVGILQVHDSLCTPRPIHGQVGPIQCI